MVTPILPLTLSQVQVVKQSCVSAIIPPYRLFTTLHSYVRCNMRLLWCFLCFVAGFLESDCFFVFVEGVVIFLRPEPCK